MGVARFIAAPCNSVHGIVGWAKGALHMATLHDVDTAIHETPGVCGGSPCIGNTRIPVWALAEVLSLYGTPEAVADYFPQLSRAQVDAGLAYYRTHTARVDAEIAENHRVYAELVARNSR